jgi:antitoxin (DNA-binding transcriptional repressor) of toxin-antitoxin stability system
VQEIIVTVEEAREKLPELIARVSAGDLVVIADEGKSLIQLTKPGMPFTDEEKKVAGEGAKAAVRAMVQRWIDDGYEVPAGSRLHELIDETKTRVSPALHESEEEKGRQTKRLQAIREMVELRIADGYPPSPESPLWQAFKQEPNPK